MPFPASHADSRIRLPIVPLQPKPFAWQQQLGAAGTGAALGKRLRKAALDAQPQIPAMAVAMVLPSITLCPQSWLALGRALLHFHFQMSVLLKHFSAPLTDLSWFILKKKLIKTYKFCCGAKLCLPACSGLNRGIDGVGDAHSKGWESCLHIPLELAPTSNTTHPTSRMFLAGFVLLYLFGTSLISAQNSVYVQKLAW